MTSKIRKTALAAVAIGSVAAFGAPAAFAAGAHITPANTAEKGTSPKAVFVGTIDGIKVTVTCTSFTSAGKTPASGLTISLPTPPKYSGCTDTTGGTDTITTSGTWKITANSTGSKVKITIPKAGATFTTNALPGCVITVAPNGPASLSGAYNNKNLLKLAGVSFPTAGNASCSAGSTSKVTQNVTFTPGFSVVG